MLGAIEHRILPVHIGGAEQLDALQFGTRLARLVENAVDGRYQSRNRVGRLHLLAEVVVDEQARGVRMRRAGQDAEIEADVGQALFRRDELHRQRLQRQPVREQLRNAHRILAAGDTALVIADVAAQHQPCCESAVL